MLHVVNFVFNDFQENTYILFDETKECVIIDPGCLNDREKKTITDYIESRGFTPVRLLNTHCHIDHVLGNDFIAEKYQLGLEVHENEIPVIEALPMVGRMYGIDVPSCPAPSRFLTDGEIIQFGSSELKVLFTPGHSPGSVSFYSAADNLAIVGDVLFKGSIGRTDLPGGDYDTLIESVETQLFTLPSETKIYPGHGEATQIGFEKMHNPFFVHQ